MMMTLSRLRWSVALSVILTALAMAQDKPARARRYLRELLRFNAEQNGNVFVAGSVIDDNGVPLSDVSVSIERSVAAGWEAQIVTETRMVDKEFDFAFRKNMSTILEFAKEGYHRRKLTFSYLRPGNSAQVDGNHHYYRGVEVVLVKIRKVTRLEWHDFFLESGAENISGWDFSKISEGGRPTLNEFSATNQLPADLLYSVISPDRETAVAENRAPEPSSTGSLLQVRLSSDTEGGFLRVAAEGKTRREILVQMREAPAEGYESTIILTARDLEALHSYKPIYFYAKLGTMYAKGRLIHYFRHSLHVDLMLQKDGSRNLETRH